MTETTTELSGPDLGRGIAPAALIEGRPVGGHLDGEPVMLVRSGGKIYATGARCTHWNGPLAEGLVEGGRVHCPWHHSCFDLETGLPNAPALNPLPCYQVEETTELVRIGPRKSASPPSRKPLVRPSAVVIVGAGAAGAAAAEGLRREGYDGPIALVGDLVSDPVDRPNLSKDYLAGIAQEEWIPLRDEAFYRDLDVDLIRGVSVTGIDPATKSVRLSDGRALRYGALLLAMGAEPIRLAIPGNDLPHVHTLRTLADSQAIIAKANELWPAVLIGASFIALEAAASLRARGVEVTVVAPEAIPLERVLGPALGSYVRKLHEAHGVRFQLGRKPVRIDQDKVTLDDGTTLDARLVVMGVGVKPRTALAEASGIEVDRGILVNEFLRSSAPDVFAAGDLARYPYFDRKVRIEHWVVAQRQGQAVAREMVGRGHPFRDVPFFWSAHYDQTIRYIGHAERWDRIEIKGSLEKESACIIYHEDGLVLAVATLNRDQALLRAACAMAENDRQELDQVLVEQ